jgi:exopolyphosphatase/guanosine-5'-triphosphate,3'-diphosphate pyrophosphatase
MDCYSCKKRKTVKASIDIGTNTALLLIAQQSENRLKVVHEEQRLPRLGQGVDKQGNLSEMAIGRVVTALKDFKAIIANHYPAVSKTVVTATSAVRDAENREDFVNEIYRETGLLVQILSGLEEAQYTFYGAQSVLPVSSIPVAVVDIGGGSTEIAYGSAPDGLIARHSFDMGCVRFTERYFDGQPPDVPEIEKCGNSIDRMLDKKNFSFDQETILIGVAGTVTSLAYMQLGCKSYSSSRLNGQIITQEILRKWINYVQKKTAVELIKKYPEVMEGRADIFLAGLLILEAIMDTYGFEKLTVSTGGIRHGALLVNGN